MINDTEIDETICDISRAANLPPEMYTSKEIFAAEQRAIFSREWIYACRADQVAKPGDYVTVEIAGAPVVVVCDKNGTVRAHSAVCRHRSALIVEGQGCAHLLRCPYHGWSYSLDGRLLGAPLMNKAENFDPADYGLVSLRAEVWEKFVFVNLDVDAPSLADKLAPLSKRLEQYALHEFRYAGSGGYTVRTNWKLWVENGMEEYHIPATHPKTLQPVQPMEEWITEPSGEAYEILLFPRSYITGTVKSPSDKGDDAAAVALIYPNFSFSPLPGVLITFDHRPIDEAHTQLVIDYYFRPDVIARDDFQDTLRGYQEALHEILIEDNHILASAYQGMESPLSRRGRYSMREQIPHRLHKYVLERLRANC